MYTQEQIDKIGNTIIYLSSKITSASKTKLLKLLYILDEASIKKSGIPMLNLEYKVWKFGPVANDIFVELDSSPSMLKDFIVIEPNVNGHNYIVPKKDFCEDEFSEFDLELLDRVISTFKDYSPKQLIEYTHREDSLWYKTAKRNGVLELLEQEKISTTELVLNMSELVEYDSRMLGLYNEYRELF